MRVLVATLIALFLMPTSVGAEGGLIEEVQKLRDQVKSLSKKIEQVQSSTLERQASAICGTINAQASTKRGSWDYGAAVSITAGMSCQERCSTFDDSGACDGLIMLHQNERSITGHRCSIRPEKVYFNEAKLFCCCR